MLVFLNLLLLAVGSQAAPKLKVQDDCRYVDEEHCHTGKEEICEDAVEWNCHNLTKLVPVGADVEVCNPTAKNVCTQKIRYEPEEYVYNECTTTTDERCVWNYDTVVKKYNVTECSTTYQKECTKVPGPPTVITREEMRCTCNICTTPLEDWEECTPRNCDAYGDCEKCPPTEKCYEGPTTHTKSGCDNEMCHTVEIHTKKMSPPGERCVETPTEYCSMVEREKTEIVKHHDCNHYPKTKCVPMTGTRQKEIMYLECLVHTEKGCKIEHKYIEKPNTKEVCDPVTKEVCGWKPKRICKTRQTQVCGDH